MQNPAEFVYAGQHMPEIFFSAFFRREKPASTCKFLTKSRMYFSILYASLEVKFPVYKIFLKHEYLNFIIDFKHLTFKPKYFNLRWNVI